MEFEVVVGSEGEGVGGGEEGVDFVAAVAGDVGFEGCHCV